MRNEENLNKFSSFVKQYLNTNGHLSACVKGSCCNEKLKLLNIYWDNIRGVRSDRKNRKES